MLKLPSNNLTELPGKFPEPVENEARSAELKDKVFRDRVRVKGFTIDDIDSPDLDDAIWLEKTESSWHVQVSISDVDTLVSRDSYTDVEALSRVHTHYFPPKETETKVLPKYSIPMLPRVLSENRLSLREGAPRPTMTVDITLSPELKLLGVKVKATSNLCAALAYGNMGPKK